MRCFAVGFGSVGAGGDRAAAAGQLSYNRRCSGLSCSHGRSRGSKGLRQFDRASSIMQQSQSVIRWRLRPAVCDLGAEGPIRQRSRTVVGFPDRCALMLSPAADLCRCNEFLRRQWRHDASCHV